MVSVARRMSLVVASFARNLSGTNVLFGGPEYFQLVIADANHQPSSFVAVPACQRNCALAIDQAG